MRDIETIDSELRLLLAIRQMVREEEGRTSSTAWADQLLDERLAHRGRAGDELPWSAEPDSETAAGASL